MIGKMPRFAPNLVGKVFGKLTVLRRLENHKSGQKFLENHLRMWDC